MPSEPIADREETSISLLADRIRAVAAAHHADDEPALRHALRALSNDANLLANRDPLLATGLAARQRIASRRQTAKI